jgi:hypothetical protein
LRFGLAKQRGDRTAIVRVRLDRHGPTARELDRGVGFVGEAGSTGVVNEHAHPVGGRRSRTARPIPPDLPVTIAIRPVTVGELASTGTRR